MKRGSIFSLILVAIATPTIHAQPALHVGFGEIDVTPDPGKSTVYLAGFGKNRVATRVHDPLFARAVVFAHDKKKIAIVSVDLVGLSNEVAQRVRKQLPGYEYILVTSTHNHEGPDTLGLWGPGPFTSGVDPEYMKFVEAGLIKAIQDADKTKAAANAHIGEAKGPELLHDGREPYVKHDDLVVLRFTNAEKKTMGLVVSGTTIRRHWRARTPRLAPITSATPSIT